MRRRLQSPQGYTLLELMLVVVLITIIGLLAYPRMSDSMRKLRSRDGAKAIVNAVVAARSQAIIRNLAYRVALTSSSDVGLRTAGAGGNIVVSRADRATCVGATFVPVEQYSFSTLGDVNLCLIRTSTSPSVDNMTGCSETTVNLCVTPDGTVTNEDVPTAEFTTAYIREYQSAQSTPTATGVVRQVVIPRRKAVQVHPIQVTDDRCI